MKKYVIIDSDSEEKGVGSAAKNERKNGQINNANGVERNGNDLVHQRPCPSTKSKEEILYWVQTKRPPCLYYYQNDLGAGKGAGQSFNGSVSYFKQTAKEGETSATNATCQSVGRLNWSLGNYNPDRSNLGPDTRLRSRQKQDTSSESDTRNISGLNAQNTIKHEPNFTDRSMQNAQIDEDHMKVDAFEFDSCSSVLTSHYIKSVNDNRFKRTARCFNVKSKKNSYFESKDMKPKTLKMSNGTSMQCKENLYEDSDQNRTKYVPNMFTNSSDVKKHGDSSSHMDLCNFAANIKKTYFKPNQVADVSMSECPQGPNLRLRLKENRMDELQTAEQFPRAISQLKNSTTVTVMDVGPNKKMLKIVQKNELYVESMN